MNDRGKNGTLVDSTTVRFERLLPGPIERVWDHLTRPELLSTWLCKTASMDVRSGGRVELTMDHGDDGIPENVKDKICILRGLEEDHPRRQPRRAGKAPRRVRLRHLRRPAVQHR